MKLVMIVPPIGRQCGVAFADCAAAVLAVTVNAASAIPARTPPKCTSACHRCLLLISPSRPPVALVCRLVPADAPRARLAASAAVGLERHFRAVTGGYS